MSNDVTPQLPGRADLESFFSRFSDDFSEFATKHNLEIKKYWHEFPSWRFNFRHPQGGVACIEIMKESENELKVYGYWWLDDYDKGTRYAKRYESEVLNVKDVSVPNLLESILRQIVSWPINSWTEIGTGFQSEWARAFTKEQFMKLRDQYPIVKL